MDEGFQMLNRKAIFVELRILRRDWSCPSAEVRSRGLRFWWWERIEVEVGGEVDEEEVIGGEATLRRLFEGLHHHCF